MPNEYYYIFFALLVGGVVGYVINVLRTQGKQQELREQLAVQQAENQSFVQQNEQQKQNDEQWEERFELLSQKIYSDQQQKHIEQGKQEIESVLKPVREQLESFRRRIDSVREQDVKERTELTEKIQQLAQLNQQMSSDAQSLTKALTGQSHTQGAWGEMVLEKVLEISGLQLGREYQTQETYKNSEGKILRPDVTVSLPNNRKVIIDSKVSLSAYHRYTDSEDDFSTEQRQRDLQEHIDSLQRHVRELAQRGYHQIQELNGLDFVLMFVPIESALTVTAHKQNELFLFALNQRILIVTPNTLFGVLRIIHAQWQVDSRSKNAEKIAQQGTKLYDQIVRFVEEFKKVGVSINQAQERYEGVLSRLTTQRGNVIQQAEKLKEMGVSSNKTLPENLP